MQTTFQRRESYVYSSDSDNGSFKNNSPRLPLEKSSEEQNTHRSNKDVKDLIEQIRLKHTKKEINDVT